MQKPKVVGFIMTYNCAHLLKDAVDLIPKGVFDELVVSDDGSIDNVEEVAKSLGLKFFTHPHLGYGGNLRFGLEKGVKEGGEILIEVHGDGQFDQSVAGEAARKMVQQDLDFLIGSRFTDLKQPLKDGMPLPRYLANIGLSFLERLVLRLPFSEFHPGFRVYRKRFVEKLDLSKGANDYLYSFQIIAVAAFKNLKCGELPVRANYNKAHTSVNYLRASMNSFQEMWVLFQYILAKCGLRFGVFND